MAWKLVCIKKLNNYLMSYKNLLFSFCLIFQVVSTFATQPVKDRESAPDYMKWNLSDIYPGWDDWQKDFELANNSLEKLTAMKGTLGSSPEALLAYYKTNDELSKLGTKLFCYPYLLRSLDARDKEVNERFQTIQASFAKVGQQLSWVSPEMVEIPKERVMNWMDSEKEFAPYKFGILNRYRLQEHILPAEQQELVSYFSLLGDSPSAIYTEVAVSDNKFPEFIRSNGEKVTLTYPVLSEILTFSTDREERQRAYVEFNNNFKSRENTMAALLSAVCKSDWAYARAYRFPGALESSLNANNIPVSVYENLISAAKENASAYQRYLALRKKVLGYSDYNSWDGSISLGEYTRKYSFDEAAQLIKQALKPLGEEYKNNLNLALQGGWIDVLEGEGKETGAYSMSVYGAHPYILLNYDQTLNYVSTLAHELGHSIHSMLSSAYQPFSTHHYSTFVAEVASNFNEELLLDYLLKNTKDHHERIALLDQAIVNLTGSFYRQSQFADFELQVHRLVEQGKPVNAGILNGIMEDLNQKYNGDILSPNELRNSVWAQVMHFYNLQFYVYQYATSYAAAIQVLQMTTTGSEVQRKDATEKYLNLLRSGGNDYPVEQLKIAGIDMTSPGPVLAVVDRLNFLIDQLEAELKAVGKI